LLTQRDDNVIFVGKKPVMNYVLACLTLFQNGSADVTLKARGLAIAKAVDAAQITTQRFAPGVTVKGIKISTEQVKDLESEATSSVSSIEIQLSK
jgi:archaea-specific DNA-binding protein